MSLARQPGPRSAPDTVMRLRCALAAAGLALFVVLFLLGMALLAARRPAAAPVAVRSRAAALKPSKRALAWVSIRLATSPRSPLVKIAERRPIIVPIAADAPPPAAAPPPAVAPRRQEAHGRLRAQQPAAVSSPAIPVEPPPAAAPSERDLGTVEAPESPPEPLVQPEARYPDNAAAEGVTGTVRLKVVVDRRGRVEDALVVRSSGDDRLDHAAEAAVRRWRYRPARRNGRAGTAIDYVAVVFDLDKEDQKGD